MATAASWRRGWASAPAPLRSRPARRARHRSPASLFGSTRQWAEAPRRRRRWRLAAPPAARRADDSLRVGPDGGRSGGAGGTRRVGRVGWAGPGGARAGAEQRLGRGEFVHHIERRGVVEGDAVTAAAGCLTRGRVGRQAVIHVVVLAQPGGGGGGERRDAVERGVERGMAAALVGAALAEAGPVLLALERLAQMRGIAVRRAAAESILSGLRRRRLEPLPPVLEPDLDRTRRHAQALRERLALIKVGQRLLVEGLDENRKLRAADLAPAWVAPARVRLREARRRQKRGGAAAARVRRAEAGGAV